MDIISFAKAKKALANYPVEIIVGREDYLSNRTIKVDFVCDGIDDDVEIQAAIDLVASYGGGTVRLLPGIYITNKTVTVENDNITLTGDYNSAVIKPNNFEDVNKHVIEVTGKFCRLQDFGIDGINRTVDIINRGFSVILSNSHNSIISRLNVSNSNSSGIYIMNSDNITVENCYVHDNQYSGITLSADGDNVNGAFIINNVCINNGLITQDVTGDIVGIHCEAISTYRIYDVLVRGNICKQNYGPGILLQKCERGSAINNIVHQNGSSGIFLQEGIDLNIVDNIIQDNGGNVVAGYKNGITLSDNGSEAIINNINISHNNFKDHIDRHIRIFGLSDKIQIKDNIFSSGAYTPISIDFNSGHDGIVKLSGNIGFSSFNSGQATIANGYTSCTIWHLLDKHYGDSTLNVNISPISSWGNASKFWVSDINDATFTINCDTNPGVDFVFTWEIRCKYDN